MAVVGLDVRAATLWARLGWGARAGLIVGALAIAVLALSLAVWSTRTDYAVLFTRLSEADAANVLEQLKRQKVPYELADGGATIKVPATQVYETRLALVSAGVPLSGGVGFEIFDRQGFGMSEQSQRVIYQRALQGELARTIGALDGVKSVRVHLVLPENTLFKRDREEARASVSLVLKAGVTLSSERTAGVQRLVAASVAGLDASKVVITDQRGITLSGADGRADGTLGSDARLGFKRDIEEYIAHKVVNLLDRAYGSGQSLVSVDVALNFDEINSSVQDVVPLRGSSNAPEGAITHRRQTQSGVAPAPALNSDSAAGGAEKPAGSTTEIDYEYGHRVEQVISAPGSISRMSVGVIVPGDLTEDKRHRITDLVRASAGINETRGDAVVVQPLEQLSVNTPTALPEAPQAGPAPEAHPSQTIPRSGIFRLMTDPRLALLVLGSALALGVTAGVAFVRLKVRGQGPLSALERQQLLSEMERALTAEAPMPAKGRV